MPAKRQSIHGQWSSKFIFILAAIGSAVGLGNIWKFPYITGEYGGGAFVLIYLLCIAAIGVPVMMAEILLGRAGRRSPINTMKALAEEQGAPSYWAFVGWSGVAAGFLILSFYSVIAGWALAYVFKAASGVLRQIDADSAALLFAEFTGAPESLLAWHTIFMVMTMVVVARGVRGGLEKAVTFLMPALFALLIAMVGYAMAEGAFTKGLHFLFDVDFKKVFEVCTVTDGVESCRISGEPLLVAMGHAFFTLSLGMGAIMVYGSYMPRRASITAATVIIALADTAVALLAGMAIFPIVFANGLEPGAGPGLIFQTLPIAFGSMPAGQLFGTLFFILLVFAAWSSSISLIEPAVAWLVENRGMNRVVACSFVGILAWFLGIGSVLSFNAWSGEEYRIFGRTLFDLKDFLASNIMLPLGGLLIALFTGWVANRALSEDELHLPSRLLFSGWWLLIRFVAPAGIILIFLHAIGAL